MCSDAGKRYLLDIEGKLGSHWAGLQERDNVVLNAIVLTIKQVQLYPENWGGRFFDLCYVFSLPLMLKLWASFSQLWYKLRLLNSLALAGDYWVFKHQTWGGTELPLVARTNCHGTLSSVSLAGSPTAPLTESISDFGMETSSSWKMPFYYFNFFHWLEFSKVLV